MHHSRIFSSYASANAGQRYKMRNHLYCSVRDSLNEDLLQLRMYNHGIESAPSLFSPDFLKPWKKSEIGNNSQRRFYFFVVQRKSIIKRQDSMPSGHYFYCWHQLTNFFHSFWKS